MTWSILICSLEERKDDLLQRLLFRLFQQLPPVTLEENVETQGQQIFIRNYGDIEILICQDNRTLSVGAKRNLLIKYASGERISFIDDDDMIAPNYASAIENAILTSPNSDVIVFDAERYENGKLDRRVKYSKQFHRDFTDKRGHYRLPNHLMVWKRDHALKVPFDHINFGEDSRWAKKMVRFISRQHVIPEVLYFYLFDSAITATQ